MANVFKKVIDQMVWRGVTSTPNAQAAGTSFCCDMRNDITRNPLAYQLVSNAILNRFNIVTKAWHGSFQNPGLAGTFGAGSTSCFVPSFAAVGTIAAGGTTTNFALTTALPTAVGVNMLANRGGSGDFGFKVRVIGLAAGKTEERFIVGNTGGTTPTLTLDAALTFTPSSGDRYEILSGRLFMLGAGTLAAGSVRTFEVATNTLASPGTTNLPATIGTDSAFVALDEQYVPFNHLPGEGFVKGTFSHDTGRVSLAATATAAGTITGQSVGGDLAVLANEYRNFQIRIVQDTVTPAAVGQRRIIASHTAGPSPVYTLGSNWTTTPSTSAKYVIEYPNLLLLRSSATTTVYTYNYTDASITNGTGTIAANAWNTTYFGAAPAANASGGLWLQCHGIQPDPAKNARHSHLYFFRGGANTLDLLDISAAIAGTWTGAIVYDGAQAFTVGTTGCYSPYGNEGRFGYLNIYAAGVANQMFRFDVKNRVLTPYTATDWVQSGTGTVGGRMAAYCAIDGTDEYDVVHLITHLNTLCYELIPLV